MSSAGPDTSTPAVSVLIKNFHLRSVCALNSKIYMHHSHRRAVLLVEFIPHFLLFLFKLICVAGHTLREMTDSSSSQSYLLVYSPVLHPMHFHLQQDIVRYVLAYSISLDMSTSSNEQIMLAIVFIDIASSNAFTLHRPDLHAHFGIHASSHSAIKWKRHRPPPTPGHAR
jgi:hypothetical protein